MECRTKQWEVGAQLVEAIRHGAITASHIRQTSHTFGEVCHFRGSLHARISCFACWLPLVLARCARAPKRRETRCFLLSTFTKQRVSRCFLQAACAKHRVSRCFLQARCAKHRVSRGFLAATFAKCRVSRGLLPVWAAACARGLAADCVCQLVRVLAARGPGAPRARARARARRNVAKRDVFC